MSSSEAYLDSLLAALSGEQNKSKVEDDSPVEAQEALALNEVEEALEVSAIESDKDNTEPEEIIAEPEEAIEEPEEIIEEPEEIIEEPEEIVEEKEIEITPVSDDPNKALGADEIAALFAQANVDMETGEEAIAEPEEAIEEPEEIIEEPEE
ncbi:MAG: hypothetical protein IJZ42_07730, partial [Lachnospiraceae bacterium]|nr:hypothetical protein [Lachnospiraceae bacterium]